MLLSEHENVGSVYTASNYATATSTLRCIEPDVILLAANLRDGESIKILKWITTRKSSQRLIITMSNKMITAESDIAMKQLGADYCIDIFDDYEAIGRIISSLN